MKVSLITAVLNARDTIGDTLDSVANQSHQNIEHIIVDGGSTDGTLEVIEHYASQIHRLISEPDQGLYDAMNKGMACASGDIIGVLNADDVFADNQVIEKAVHVLRHDDYDAVYGDLVYVDNADIGHVKRSYISGHYKKGKVFLGWMPAHATLYLKREVQRRIGDYNLDAGLQADLEYCARAFEIHQIRAHYVEQVWVRMRLGGLSNRSVRQRIQANWQSYKALRALGLKRDPFSFFVVKFAHKLPGFFRSEQ